ncbi:MAG: outer membrane lipid asymmetry maintenance protein MlaD [Proteobacteria bacterium]|nr:outer membrane lipid asymmetry maintenance protein MlaD [Pseudomonadota bacterium]
MSEEKNEFKVPKKSLTIEFWVGIFAVLGLATSAYLSLNIASIKISNSGYYDITAEFSSVSGLKLGAPVEIAGVEVGEVSSIVLKDTSALIGLRIKNDIKLRDDDIAAIRTKGIIGDRYVKVIPGGSDKMIDSGGRLSDTESAMEFEDVIGKFIHKFES